MQIKTVPEDFIVVELADHKVSDEGPYLLLEMTKRNLTTEKALEAIALRLRIQRKHVGYAGTKDARALTRQYITVPSSTKQQVLQCTLSNPAVRLLGHVAEPLRLGMLTGNRFEIVVRNICSEKLLVLHTIPNYFDEQRFSKMNAVIGKRLLKKEFEQAVSAILLTDDTTRMNEYLSSHPNDFVGALRQIPKHVLLLYVHAYQSMLYNEVLSQYILENDPLSVVVDGPVPMRVPSRDLVSVMIPLLGFGTEHDPVFSPLYDAILAREGLTMRDFIVRSIPFLTVEGGMRSAFFVVQDLASEAPLVDESGQQRQLLKFALPKGCYATTAVKCWYRVGRILGGS